MGMDEHDKRAREVLDEAAKVQLRHGTPEAAAVIASALRSTAAAAVAAEREKWQPLAKAARAVMLAGKSDDPDVHDAAWGALRAALTAAPAAQGERPSVDLDTPWCLTVNGPMNVTPTLAGAISAALSPAPLASPAQAERDEYEVRFETVTDAHARGCRETQHRIAARLRARADEEQAGADAIRARWLEHGDRPGDAAQMQCAEAVMAALRAEADALEVGT